MSVHRRVASLALIASVACSSDVSCPEGTKERKGACIEIPDGGFDTDENPEGNKFALSPTGKKYFINAVMKVTGMVNQRLSRTAAELPARIDPAAAEIQAALQGFRRGGAS